MSRRPSRPAPARALLALTFALSLALPPSPAQAGDPVDARALDNIELLLSQWREPEAFKQLELLAKAGASGPRFLQVRGRVRYLQGDYDGALKDLNMAVSRQAASPLLKAFRSRVAATRDQVKGYKRFPSPGGHFVIYTPAGKDEILAPFAAQTLEAARLALKQDLGYAPSDPIRVEIYPTAESLALVSGLTVTDIGRTGTIALCHDNRLMIVSPRALLRGYGWMDTLAHEYSHMVVSRVSHNTVPIWLHEGLAKVFERRWRQPAGERAQLAPVQKHLLAEALRGKKLVSWRSMHPSMAKLPDQRTTTLAFAQVQTAVDLLIRRLGLGGLGKMLVLMRAGKANAWQALEQVGGLTMDRFTAEWRRHLAGLDLRTLPGFKPLRLKLGVAPSAEQRLAQVRQKRARDFLRLANLLRSRRRTRAAIVEYRKARKILGDRDDLVANHLARSYLEVASPAQAIAALLPVLEYYPELPGPQVTMGMAYLRAGDPRSAARHLRAGLRINPFSPELHCGLGEALKEISSVEAALHDKMCARLNRTGRSNASPDR